MKRMTLKSEYNWNLLYDPEAIKAAALYLFKNNRSIQYRSVSEWNDYISSYMMKRVSELAKLYHTDPDWETKWSTFSGTGGFMFIFTIADTTKNNYPVIQADLYVTPNISNYGTIETKFRTS